MWAARLGALLGVLSLAAVGGCRKPATGLRVLVTTDFAPSDTTPPLHSVVLRVRRVGDSLASVPLREQEVTFGPRGEGLPLKFSVFLATNPGEQVVIEAEAHTLASRMQPRPGGDGVGDPVTVARVITGFLEGEIRVVPMVLYRGCWDRALVCSPEQTCGPSAECESARRDPAMLPRLDPDAGDPTDAFAPAVPRDGGIDAREPDVSSPSGGDATPPDAGARDATAMDGAGGGPCVPPPTVRVSTVQADLATPANEIDLAVRTPPSSPDGGVSDGGAIPDASLPPGAGAPTVEIVWAQTVGMDLLATGASMTWSGAGGAPALSRSPAMLGSFSVPSGRGLRVASYPSGQMALFAVSVMMGPMPSLTVNSALLDGVVSGLGAPFSLRSWPDPIVGAQPANSVVVPASFDEMRRSTIVGCVASPNASRLECFHSRTGYEGSGADIPRRFSVSLPGIVMNPRLVAMVIEGPVLRFALELANGTGIASCGADVRLDTTPIEVGAVDCATMLQMDGQVIPGSTSAQWISGSACGGGWFAAAVQQVGGGGVLRVGRIDTGAFEGFARAESRPADARTTTSLSVSTSACEALVAHRYGSTLDLVRVRLRERIAGGRFSVMGSVAAARMLPTSQRFGEREEQYVGVALADADPGSGLGRRVELFTVPVSERCPGGM
jgi:hypothetical protein